MAALCYRKIYMLTSNEDNLKPKVAFAIEPKQKPGQSNKYTLKEDDAQ